MPALDHPFNASLDGSGKHIALGAQRSVVGEGVGFSAVTVNGSAGFAIVVAGSARLAKSASKRAHCLAGGDVGDW